MKKSFLVIMSAAILASCSETDLIERGQSGGSDVAIEASSVHKSVSGEVDSRAPYVGTISDSNPLTARVLTSKVTANYSSANLHASGKMVFKGGSSSYELPSVTVAQTKFPSSTDQLYICGLHPLDTWTVSGTTAAIALTGKEDVMSAPQQSTSATLVKGGTVPSLQFSHLLTKLEVKLKAKTSAANGAWGDIQKVEILQAGGSALKNVATVTLETGVSAFSGTATSFTMCGMSETGGVASYTDVDFAGHTLTETAVPVAYTLVAPFTADGSDDLKLRVTTQYLGTKEVNIDLTTYSGYTAGYAFGITLTFNVEDETIEASATVIDWKTGGDVEKEISNN